MSYSFYTIPMYWPYTFCFSSYTGVVILSNLQTCHLTGLSAALLASFLRIFRRDLAIEVSQLLFHMIMS